MSDNFWFLPDDGSESDAERPERSGVSFDARDSFEPFREPMKGNRSRPQRAPSTDQKKVRRQIHRSGQHVAYSEAFAEPDWDDLHPHLKDMAENGELHRGVGVNLPDDLHRFVHDESKPQHERAMALINHLAGERSGGDHRYGLGMHWSLDNGVAEDFGEKMADHIADVNRGDHKDHDFSWGKHLDDGEALAAHLYEHHGVAMAHHADSPQTLQQAHEHLHRGAPPMPGQQALFPEPPREPKANYHLEQEHWTPYAKPGTAIVLHTPIPEREDIEEHPQGNPNAGGDVYHPLNHGEREVPIRSGASLPITGISWKPMYTFQDDRDDAEYTHHRFDQQPHREARKTAAYQTDRMPPHERVTDWDDVMGDHDTGDWRIHRGVKLWPKGDLWDRVNDESRPVHERARELVDHITSQRGNLGMHWSSDEDFAKRVAKDGGWSAIGNNGAPKDMEYALSMPVVIHARWPRKEHFETDPNELHANHVLPYGYGENLADEWETPLKKGAPVHITGVTWSGYEHPRDHEWTHHSFDEPIKHTATVLNTQIERLNKGDQIRTPTGQTSVVQGTRPHETDSTLMYLDTDMGTSTVKRGTDFQTVPHNSQQQEMPDTGNPMGSGNSGSLPMSGRTPGGAGNTPTAPPGVCPNCGNAGTMHLHSGNYVCGVCGFTVPAGGTPGGLMFTNQPGGYSPARRKPGEVPRAHVWASRYVTSNEHTSQVARRARRVSGGDQ